MKILTPLNKRNRLLIKQYARIIMSVHTPVVII